MVRVIIFFLCAIAPAFSENSPYRHTTCTHTEIKDCERECREMCDRNYIFRPYASKNSNIRVTRNLCTKECPTMCLHTRQQLKANLHGLKAPLARLIQDFYQEAGCFPKKAPPWYSSLFFWKSAFTH